MVRRGLPAASVRWTWSGRLRDRARGVGVSSTSTTAALGAFDARSVSRASTREPRPRRPLPDPRRALGSGVRGSRAGAGRTRAPTTAGSSTSAARARPADPIAHVSLGLPEEAEREVARAARDGVKGLFIAPFVMTRKAPGHPDHDRVFRAAEEAGLPVGIHPAFEPFWALPGRFGRMTDSSLSFIINVTAADAVRHAFTSFFQFRRLRQVPAAQGRGAGVRRGVGSATGSSAMDAGLRLTARPERAPPREAEAPTSSASAGSPPTPTSARSPASSRWSARTASSGPRTSRTRPRAPLPRRAGGAGVDAARVGALEADERQRPRGLRAASALDHDPRQNAT